MQDTLDAATNGPLPATPDTVTEPTVESPAKGFLQYLRTQFPERPATRRADRKAEWEELDAAIRPYLYCFVKEIGWPGAVSSHGGYFEAPQLSLKICLKTGNVFSMANGKMVANYFEVWLGHSGLSWDKTSLARESLKAWIEEQILLPPEAHTIPLFNEDPAELDRKFYAMMFGYYATEFTYRGNAKKLWQAFEKIHGPVRTKKLVDLSSYPRLLKFLRYRLENPSKLFSVELVSGPRKKELVFELKDRSMR